MQEGVCTAWQCFEYSTCPGGRPIYVMLTRRVFTEDDHHHRRPPSLTWSSFLVCPSLLPCSHRLYAERCPQESCSHGWRQGLPGPSRPLLILNPLSHKVPPTPLLLKRQLAGKAFRHSQLIWSIGITLKLISVANILGNNLRYSFLTQRQNWPATILIFQSLWPSLKRFVSHYWSQSGISGGPAGTEGASGRLWPTIPHHHHAHYIDHHSTPCPLSHHHSTPPHYIGQQSTPPPCPLSTIHSGPPSIPSFHTVAQHSKPAGPLYWPPFHTMPSIRPPFHNTMPTFQPPCLLYLPYHQHTHYHQTHYQTAMQPIVLTMKPWFKKLQSCHFAFTTYILLERLSLLMKWIDTISQGRNPLAIVANKNISKLYLSSKCAKSCWFVWCCNSVTQRIQQCPGKVVSLVPSLLICTLSMSFLASIKSFVFLFFIFVHHVAVQLWHKWYLENVECPVAPPHLQFTSALFAFRQTLCISPPTNIVRSSST